MLTVERSVKITKNIFDDCLTENIFIRYNFALDMILI